MRSTQRTVLYAAVIVSSLVHAAVKESLTSREWSVEGVKREAVVHIPADQTLPAPLVFVFHGHGGSMSQAARSFHIHELWSEAIVVYPQGLKTPGRLTDPEGNRTGWQSGKGKEGDRDFKFYDAMLDSFRKDLNVDEDRIYITGHSNGGAFTYMLWAARGDQIAAVAPSGALDREDMREFKPKPVLHIAGRKDPLVKFEWQKAMIDFDLKLNQCDLDSAKTTGDLTTYTSGLRIPVVTYLYDGGHQFPQEALPEIVKFFKAHPRGATTQPLAEK